MSPWGDCTSARRVPLPDRDAATLLSVKIRHEFEVRVPPDGAFGFFSDPNRAFERLGTNLHVRWLEPIGPGARYEVDAGTHGDSYEGVVDRYEPPRRLRIRMWTRAQPDRGGTTEMEFEPTPTGTLVRATLSTEMGRFLELGAFVIRPLLSRQSRRGMERMASILEADDHAGRLPPA
jgi:uncharacterized protein YndB with AHSA1/START domain